MVRQWVVWLAAAGLMGGCASGARENLRPVAWNAQAVRAETSRIGVVLRVLPEREANYPGARCLMCRPLAAASNSALTAHVAALDGVEELTALKAEAAALLRNRGIDVVDIPDAIEAELLPGDTGDAVDAAAPLAPEVDALRQRHQLGRLMVFEFDTLGVHRPYVHYAPASFPYAVVSGRAYLLDVKSRKVQWMHRMRATLTAEGEWEEPPEFPGLTNAYFQAIEKVKDRVMQILGR